MTARSQRPHAHLQPTYPSANVALEAHLDLIERASRQFRLSDSDRDDAYQEAAVAFLLHYANYDPGRGVPLVAYMWPRVFGAVRHLVRRLVSDREAVSHVDPVDLDLPDPSRVSDGILDVDVEHFLRSLLPHDRALIARLFWYDEEPIHIARSLGVSRQTIHARRRRLLDRGQTIIAAANAA